MLWRTRRVDALVRREPGFLGDERRGRRAHPHRRGDGLVEQIPSEWGNGILRWIYYTIYVGASLPVGQCCAGDSPLFGIFKLHGSEIKRALVPISELNYEFESNWILSVMTRESFWCVSEPEGEASDEDLKVASRRLAVAKSEHRCVSKKILTNTRSTGIAAVWSSRLSLRGILKQNDGRQMLVNGLPEYSRMLDDSSAFPDPLEGLRRTRLAGCKRHRAILTDRDIASARSQGDAAQHRELLDGCCPLSSIVVPVFFI